MLQALALKNRENALPIYFREQYNIVFPEINRQGFVEFCSPLQKAMCSYIVYYIYTSQLLCWPKFSCYDYCGDQSHK